MAAKDKKFEPVDHHLDLDEALPLHARDWTAQKIFGVLIFLLTVAIACGLFGGGPLSATTLEQSDVIVRYERFLRLSNETLLEVRAAAPENEIRFASAWLDHFKLDRVVPEPHAVRGMNGDIVYVFRGEGRTTMRFYLEPRRPGLTRSALGVNGRAFELTHFIYP